MKSAMLKWKSRVETFGAIKYITPQKSAPIVRNGIDKVIDTKDICQYVAGHRDNTIDYKNGDRDCFVFGHNKGGR